MADKETVEINIDAELRNQATVVLEDHGIDLSLAVSLFLKTVVATKSIAFALTPNAATQAAMREADQLDATMSARLARGLSAFPDYKTDDGSQKNSTSTRADTGPNGNGVDNHTQPARKKRRTTTTV